MITVGTPRPVVPARRLALDAAELTVLADRAEVTLPPDLRFEVDEVAVRLDGTTAEDLLAAAEQRLRQGEPWTATAGCPVPCSRTCTAWSAGGSGCARRTAAGASRWSPTTGSRPVPAGRWCGSATASSCRRTTTAPGAASCSGWCPSGPTCRAPPRPSTSGGWTTWPPPGRSPTTSTSSRPPWWARCWDSPRRTGTGSGRSWVGAAASCTAWSPTPAADCPRSWSGSTPSPAGGR